MCIRDRWKDAQDAPVVHDLAGNPATVDMVTKVMFPVGKMDGDSLPVSAFEKDVYKRQSQVRRPGPCARRAHGRYGVRAAAQTHCCARH